MTTRGSDYDTTEEKRLRAEIDESQYWIDRLNGLLNGGRMTGQSAERARVSIDYHQNRLSKSQLILDAITGKAKHDANRKDRAKGA